MRRRGRRAARLRQRDQHHADQDHRHRAEVVRGERFAADQRADQHRERRIDVGVAGGERGPHVVQQPDVGGEAEDRTGDDQIQQRGGGAGARHRRDAFARAAPRRRMQPQRAGEHLPRGGHERLGQVLVAAPDRPPRPRERRDDQAHQARAANPTAHRRR